MEKINIIEKLLAVKENLQTKLLLKSDIEECSSMINKCNPKDFGKIMEIVVIQDDILITIIDRLFNSIHYKELLEYLDYISKYEYFSRKVISHLFKLINDECVHYLPELLRLMTREQVNLDKLPILLLLIERSRNQNNEKYLLVAEKYFNSTFIKINCYPDYIKNILLLKYFDFSLSSPRRSKILTNLLLKCGKSYQNYLFSDPKKFALLDDVDLNSIGYLLSVKSNKEQYDNLKRIKWIRNTHSSVSIKPDVSSSNLDVKKLKIAVCVSGQLRGYQDAFKTWGNLGLNDHNVDYFIHSWDNIGRRTPTPGHAHRVFTASFIKLYQKLYDRLGFDSILEQYPTFANYYRNNSYISEENINAFYNANKVVLDDDQSELFSSYNNPTKMYYKISKCFELIRHDANEYDLVIRIRPDILIKESPDFCLKRIYERVTFYQEFFCDKSPRINRFVGTIVGDQIAIGSPKQMKIYSRTFNEQNELQGHVSLFNQLLENQVACMGLSKKLNVGSLLDVNIIDKKIISDTFGQDAVLRLKEKVDTFEDKLILEYLTNENIL